MQQQLMTEEASLKTQGSMGNFEEKNEKGVVMWNFRSYAVITIKE